MPKYYVNAGYTIRHRITANSPCEAACKIAAKYGTRSQDPIIYVDERGWRGVIGVETMFDNQTFSYDRDYILQSIKGVNFES